MAFVAKAPDHGGTSVLIAQPSVPIGLGRRFDGVRGSDKSRLMRGHLANRLAGGTQ